MQSMYDVLGVEPTAEPAQLKAAYRALALQSHPDKAAAASPESASHFLLVQRAWEVLRDPSLRAVHDRELALEAMRAVMTFQDELDLDEMDEDEGAFVAWCRCGSQYSLATSEVVAVQSSIAIPCLSCSNHILVYVREKHRERARQVQPAGASGA